MGGNLTRLMTKRHIVVVFIVVIAAALGIVAVALSQPTKVSYAKKPAIVYEGVVYGASDHRHTLPDDAQLLGTVQHSLNDGGRQVDASDDDFSSNVFDVGTEVYGAQGRLFVEGPERGWTILTPMGE